MRKKLKTKDWPKPLRSLYLGTLFSSHKKTRAANRQRRLAARLDELLARHKKGEKVFSGSLLTYPAKFERCLKDLVSGKEEKKISAIRLLADEKRLHKLFELMATQDP